MLRRLLAHAAPVHLAVMAASAAVFVATGAAWALGLS